MEAEKFLNEWKRLCGKTKCSNCPVSEFCCFSFDGFEPSSMCGFAEFVQAVSDWAKAHPQKTRIQDFKERYPNAPLKPGARIPKACALELGYCDSCEYVNSSCVRCWNQPLE